MPEISSEKVTAVAYPPQSLYDAWCKQADASNMSTSQYIIRMVEAGRKNVSMADASTESIRELIQKRNSLQREVERQRDRILDLERQLQRTTHSDIVSFVADNPGAETPEITQHVADTVPGRVAGHLDALEGDAIEKQADGYYPIESDD